MFPPTEMNNPNELELFQSPNKGKKETIPQCESGKRENNGNKSKIQVPSGVNSLLQIALDKIFNFNADYDGIVEEIANSSTSFSLYRKDLSDETSKYFFPIDETMQNENTNQDMFPLKLVDEDSHLEEILLPENNDIIEELIFENSFELFTLRVSSIGSEKFKD